MNCKLFLVGALMLITFINIVGPGMCQATEIALIYKDEASVSLKMGSVFISQAKVVKENGNLKVTGQLKRAHKLAMPGHLHAYMYSDGGLLLANSKQKVLGLNSKRKGMIRISFNILLEDFPIETSKVILKYHRVNHPTDQLTHL